MKHYHDTFMKLYIYSDELSILREDHRYLMIFAGGTSEPFLWSTEQRVGQTSSNGVSPGHQETKTEAFSHLRRENETQVYLPKATWDMRATTVGWTLKKPLSPAISYSSCYLPLLLCLELPCIILSTGSQSSKCSSFSFPYMLLHSGVLRVFPLCCLSQVQGSARFVICFFQITVC